MKRVGGFLKLAVKWSAILTAIYVGSNIFSGLELETRIWLLLFGLAMGLAYVDGTQKDRIFDLELRIHRLERRQNGDISRFDFD